jgi:hypothetical protein
VTFIIKKQTIPDIACFPNKIFKEWITVYIDVFFALYFTNGHSNYACPNIITLYEKYEKYQ